MAYELGKGWMKPVCLYLFIVFYYEFLPISEVDFVVVSVVIFWAGGCERLEFSFPLCHNATPVVNRTPIVMPNSTGSIIHLLRIVAIGSRSLYYNSSGALVSVSLPVFLAQCHNMLSSVQYFVSVHPH